MKILSQPLAESVESLNEFTTIGKEQTGLSVIVWVLVKEPTIRSSPSIKFQNSTDDKIQPNNLVAISVEDEPRILDSNIRLLISAAELEEIKQWVIKNKKLLLQYWNLKITSICVIKNLRKNT